jgi:NAD(P)-dependent dehydrogenase (short-subunit alcohol dehydrogenase family)
MASLAARLPGVALITGAGGTGINQTLPCTDQLTYTTSIGIGAAVAKAFARSGCTRIAITDVNKETLAQTQASILKISPQAQVLCVDGDISDESFVTSFADQVAKKFSRLDYAVNSAGILGASLRSHETPVEAFDKINKVNYRGSWLCSRAALRLMLKQEPLDEHPEQRGSIVNIASQLGVVARPSAGKHPFPLS